MSDILYNFSANTGSIGDVNALIQGIQEVRSDIDNVFKVLGTVYEGEGSLALNGAHAKISSLLDDLLNETATTQRHAQDQQDTMQALDRANAAAF